MEIERLLELRTLFPLALNLLRSKMFCFKSRLIRFPFYCKGKKYIEWGKSLTTGVGCRLEALKLKEQKNPILKFGNNVQLNDYVHICALKSVFIGNDVLMASHVYISDNTHGAYKGDENDSSPLISPIQRNYLTNPVEIGDRVWIGEGVMILPGVKIGEGAIIGAHSVVNKDIPANTIAVGSPAKVIKKYNFDTSHWEKV